MQATSINNIIGEPFIELDSVDSTNNYAMQLVKKEAAKHGAAYFAYQQTAGKGQRKKQWLSSKGENIILSVILDTSRLQLSKQFLLNTVTALAVKDLFNKYTTEKIKIKWPNDIYFDDRKAAGILIESIINGSNWQFAVAGFGVNINQTSYDSILKNPVSLKQITAESYSVVQLSKELCGLLQSRFQQLLNEDFFGLMNEYNLNLYKQNETVKLKKGSRVFEARIIKVDENGRLIVDAMGEEAFEFGSIEWVINI